MRKSELALLVILVIAGCVNPASQHQENIAEHLGADFTTRFDHLFLSQEPLRYQDNTAFLSGIPLEKLSSVEKELLIEKLKQFLSLGEIKREITSDSTHTGVASEMAFLRLKAVQILSVIGSGEDADFIHSLVTNVEGEHPGFEDECMKAIRMINASE